MFKYEPNLETFFPLVIRTDIVGAYLLSYLPLFERLFRDQGIRDDFLVTIKGEAQLDELIETLSQGFDLTKASWHVCTSLGIEVPPEAVSGRRLCYPIPGVLGVPNWETAGNDFLSEYKEATFRMIDVYNWRRNPDDYPSFSA